MLDTSHKIFFTFDRSTKQYDESIKRPIINANFSVICRLKIELIQANSIYNIGLKDEIGR